MHQILPLGEARRKRPDKVFRYTFEHFARFGVLPPASPLPPHDERLVVPIEAAVDGDVQVLAARTPGPEKCVADLDGLVALPSVESVVAGTQVLTTRPLPAVRELLVAPFAEFPEASTLRMLTGMQRLSAASLGYITNLDLDALPTDQMRKLAVNRWKTRNLGRLRDMTGLVSLSVDLYREPLDLVAGLGELRFLVVRGPARGWAKLRECTELESAAFSDVEMANLKRWNTWTSLRELALTGRGLKSLAGLEALERLEYLALCNLHMEDLSPLGDLRHLFSLVLRMPAGRFDLASIARAPALKSLVIDESVITDRDIKRLPSLRPLAGACALEDLELTGVCVEDADLSPLAEIPHLRRVKLGQDIGADVDRLRAARPDLEVLYTPPPPRRTDLEERIGKVTINRPGDGIDQWWIFDNLAGALGTSTNYAAEKRIRTAIKRQDARLATRLEWDAEGGAVGIFAKEETDIRRVAEVINGLLASGSPA